MTTATRLKLEPLKLHAQTAGEVMSENPVSIRHDATIREAVELMLQARFD